MFNFLKIEKVEPKIVEITEKINVIGLSIRTSDKTIFKDLPKIYTEYMKIKNDNKIKNIKEPWEYISLSKNFHGTESWDYYTGPVVNSYQDNTEDLVKFEVPSGKYAVFPVRCKNKSLFGLKIGKTKRYIYKEWLPKSGYEFDGIEYEYNNEEMNKKSPYDIDLYVKIKEKN